VGGAIFVTASDTEVGKTFCSCAIAEAFWSDGLSVGVYKPVLSGLSWCDSSETLDDATLLQSAAGSTDDIALINPYRFDAAVTPAHAAHLENVKIDKQKLHENYNDIKARHDITIVEGAGGLMSPVTDDYLNIDMICDFQCPVIVVTDTKLGRINHTLMTLNLLKERGAEVLGVIVNMYPKDPNEANKSLIKYIELFSDVKILAVIEKGDGSSDPAAFNVITDLIQDLV